MNEVKKVSDFFIAFFVNRITIDIFSGCSLIELFFEGGIPYFSENSYQECEEIVRSFLSSFRLVPHNVNGIPPTL